MRLAVRPPHPCRAGSPAPDPFGIRRARTTEVGPMPYGVMKHPQLTVGRNRLQFPVGRGPVPRDPCSRQKPSEALGWRISLKSKVGEGQALALRVMTGNGEGQALALRDMRGAGEGNPLACACGMRGPKPYGPGAVNFSNNRLPSSLASCVKNRFAAAYAAAGMRRSFKVNVNR